MDLSQGYEDVGEEYRVLEALHGSSQRLHHHISMLLQEVVVQKDILIAVMVWLGQPDEQRLEILVRLEQPRTKGYLL